MEKELSGLNVDIIKLGGRGMPVAGFRKTMPWRASDLGRIADGSEQRSASEGVFLRSNFTAQGRLITLLSGTGSAHRRMVAERGA